MATHQNAHGEGGIISDACKTQIIVTKHDLRQLAVYGVLTLDNYTYHIVESVEGLWVAGRGKWHHIGNRVVNRHSKSVIRERVRRLGATAQNNQGERRSAGHEG